MPEQMRPASKDQAPDPAHSYERAKPERESSSGRLEATRPRPSNQPDRVQDAVRNRNTPRGQINAQDATRERGGPAPELQQHQERPVPVQPDHSMHEEEPLGWDQAPIGATPPDHKRHPRKEGKGGTR